MKKNLLLVLALMLSYNSFAITYYSFSNSVVNLPASWKDSVGASPANFSGLTNVFIIKSGHTMTTTGRWAIGANNASNKNILQIESGGTLNATNLIDVPVFKIDNGGTYIHNTVGSGGVNNTNDFPGYGTVANGFTAPRVFGASNTVEIQKWGNGAITLYNSTESLPTVEWGNLIINIPTLSASWRNAKTPFTVKGDLIIKATGGGSNAFKIGGSTAVTVGGDFRMEGGKFSLTEEIGSSYANNYSMNVAGDFIQTGGSFTLADQAVGTTNHFLTVGGNTILSGGYFGGSGFITGPYTDATKVTDITDITAFPGAPSSSPQALTWGLGGMGIQTPQSGSIINAITGNTYTLSTQSLFSETANATLFAGPLITGCTVTNGSAVVTVPDVSVFRVGMRVATAYIPYGAKITAIGSGSITLSANGMGGRTNATLVPEYVSLKGNTAGYNNTNFTMNLNGDFTVGAGATFAWVNADKDIKSASIVVGGDFTIDAAATFINPPAWTDEFGGATVYFKGGKSAVNLTVPAGKANSNIAWIVATGKTLTLQNNLTVDKFFTVAGTLTNGNRIVDSAPPINLGSESAYSFNAKLYLGNDNRITNVPASGALELGMELTSTGGYLAPNTVITQIIPGPVYSIAISPASISGNNQYASTPFNAAIAVGTTLPLKLVSFRATLTAKNVELTWSTAQEDGVKEFIVEKSANGIAFTAIENPVSATNTAGNHSYSLVDINGRLYKENYYRLKMVDLDGKVSYSKNFEYISVPVLESAVGITAFPNPTQNLINIAHPEAAPGAKITILSINGVVLANVPVVQHSLLTQYNTTALAAGSYIIVYTNQGKSTKSQFIKI